MINYTHQSLRKVVFFMSRRDIEYIQARSPQDFAEEYRKICRKIDLIGEVVDHYIISPVEAHIFYELTSEPGPKKEEKNVRHCCECPVFDWHRRCPYKKGQVVNHMDIACDYFGIFPEEVQS